MLILNPSRYKREGMQNAPKKVHILWKSAPQKVHIITKSALFLVRF